MADTWRLFYGIAPSSEAKAALTRAAGQVRCDRGRLYDESLYHLTLIFLGNLPPDYVPRLKQIAVDAWRGDFPLTLSGHVGTFKGGSVLWAGLCDNPALYALHGRLRRGLMAAGLPAGDEGCTPHITLGRGMKLLKPLPTVDMVTFLAKGITLYHSTRIDGVLKYIPL